MGDVVLGLDVATRTGWAINGPMSGVPIVGTFKAPRPEGDKAEGFDLGPVFLAFRRWLDGMIVIHKPDTVAFEAPLNIVHGGSAKVLTNQNTIRLLFGFAALVEMCASEHGVPTYEANVGTIKRHFAGHGRADKAAMMARCRMLGWAVADDNQADAAALWAYVSALKNPKFSIMTTPLYGRRA